MSAYRIKKADLNTASFDVPVPGFYNPPKHFSAFTMLDNGECVATRGRTTITRKLFPSGDYFVSDIIDGHLVEKRYVFYTKREAERLFRNEFKPRKKGVKP